jgi:restriction system protein
LKGDPMALWLVRAGKYGEYEEKFFGSPRIYLTWTTVQDYDLGKAKDWEGIKNILRQAYPGETERRLGNYTGQAWAFVIPMKPGDWVVVPRKTRPAIAFGEINGPYTYDPKVDPLYRHSRSVKWLNLDVPRSAFDQDLLYSFGAFMTVCQIARNDAEKRVRAMAKAGWKASPGVTAPKPETGVAPEASDKPADLERLSRDQIAMLIAQRLKGHGMARLVEALLKAQGYTTYRSPEGPDKGVDILAAPGPMGFGQPRICVQVKSGDTPVDAPTLDQLKGAMDRVKANQGLLVSWSGFKSSIDKDTAFNFFQVRLWDQDALVNELLANYDRLDEDLRAELPLKRIWTLAMQDDES